MDRKEFNTLQNIRYELGWTAIRLGITNPDAIPKMVEFMQDIVKRRSIGCDCGKGKAEAILKEAGVY